MDERTAPTPHRKPGRELYILLGVVGVLALLISLYVFTLGRSPLAGPNSHDFGYVMLDEGGASVDHTFTLTNRTRRTLELGEPRPSCGCTVSGLSQNRLEPGEEVSVTATLTISRPGRRSSDIAIPIDGRGVRMLHVSGIGRPKAEIHSRREQIIFASNDELTIGFNVDAWPDAWDDVLDVPEPTITAPDGVTARLDEWALRVVPRQDRPAQWNGRVTVTRDADELPDDAQVTVTLREGQSLEIPVAIADRRE